jgi:acyl-CoA synthetase (AMP-forming)/AMP-acid ligase II
VVSVGVPVAGVEVEVRDEAGRVVPERRLGRIFVRGPSVMRGYLGQPEASARALTDGWLDTGDLGFVDGGELFVHGRVKDVIVVRGANHAPDEIEGALLAVPGIRRGCSIAIGFEPGDRGEELLVLAERSGTPGDDEAVREAARRAVLERTGLSPHTIELVPPGTLPRTSSGKMRRGEARRRWLAGALEPPAAVNAASMAGALVRSAVGYLRARLSPADDGPATG